MAGFSGFGIRFVLEVLASVVGHARACLLDGTFPLQVSIGPDGPVRTESEGHLSGDGRVGPPRRTARAPGRAGRLARPPRSPFPYMRAPAPRRRGGLSEPAGQSGSPQVTMGEMVDLTPIRSGRLIFFPLSLDPTPTPCPTCRSTSSRTSPFLAVDARIVNYLSTCDPMLMPTQAGPG